MSSPKGGSRRRQRLTSLQVDPCSDTAHRKDLQHAGGALDSARPQKPVKGSTSLPRALKFVQRSFDCGTSSTSDGSELDILSPTASTHAPNSEYEESPHESECTETLWEDEVSGWPEALRPPEAAVRRAPTVSRGGKFLFLPGEPVYDVVATPEGDTLLLPLDAGSDITPRLVKDMDEDELVTIRVFRFFEERSHEQFEWERELRNVNSGSLLWLLVHMTPKMHSVKGAKYGNWFTAHYIQIRAKDFNGNYHMCLSGCAGPAKSFGCTLAQTTLVTGKTLNKGYFWYVSPVRQDAAASPEDVTDAAGLEHRGWRHRGRSGPFDGETFLELWEKLGAEPDDELAIRAVLDSMFATEG